MHIVHLANRTLRRLCQTALLVLGSVSMAPALAASMPEGMLGWWYYTGVFAPPGYASNPVEACELNAKNHMGTALLDMRPFGDSGLMFQCKYRHFLQVGGEQWFGQTLLFCKSGYRAKLPGVCVKDTIATAEPPKPLSCKPGTPGYAVGDPVIISTGANVQTELDYPGTGAGTLRIARTFRTSRSIWNLGTPGGWTQSFDVSLNSQNSYASDGHPLVLYGEFGDGSQFRFNWSPTKAKYTESTDKTASLAPLSSSYEDWLLTKDDRAYRFKQLPRSDEPGSGARFQLVSVHYLDGRAEYYSHDSTTALTAITDHQGRKLEFGIVDHRDISIRTPTLTVVYTNTQLYENAAWLGISLPFFNLTQVNYLDTAGGRFDTKQFDYSGFLLTGITDENGARYATFQYDDNSRVTLAEHAGGTYRYTFAYPDDTTRLVTDPLGTQRKIGLRYYGAGGVSTGGNQPAGSGCGPAANTITHDFDGNIASETDFNGNKTCYIRDARGLETGRISGLSSDESCPASLAQGPATDSTRRVATRWHPDYPFVSGVAVPKLMTTYVYNGQTDAGGTAARCAPAEAALPNGKLLPLLCRKTEQQTSDAGGIAGFNAQTLGAARVWSYTYDAQGRLLTATGPANAQGQARSEARTYYLDATMTHAAGDLATVANAAGEVTQYLEYTPDGRPIRIKRPDGQTLNIGYDHRQRLVSITTEDSSGLSERTAYDYDAVGNLLRVTPPDGSAVSYAYDAAHRLTDISDNAGNTIHLDLDGMGNIVGQEVRGANHELALRVKRSFDALNRLQSEQHGSEARGTTFQYDRSGNLTALVDQLGRATTNVYDSLNRITRQQLPTPALNSSRHVIDFTYDQQDQLLSVTDPKLLKTSYTVDGFGQRLVTTSPDTGESKRVFDADGTVMSRRDARGTITEYAYDAAGRLTRSGSSRYEYGAPATPAAGKLALMRDDSGQSVYSYGAFGRLLKKTQSVVPGSSAPAQRTSAAQSKTQSLSAALSPKNFSLSYTYGNTGPATGHLTAITYPSGNRIEFNYGSDGRRSDISLVLPGMAGSVALVRGIAYRPDGGIAGWTWGNSVGTKPNTYLRTFDDQGRLRTLPLGHPEYGGVLRTLTYDAAGRITSSTHTGNAGASRLDQQYSYDDLDRLTGFQTAGMSQAFTYDKNGNRSLARFGANTYSNAVSATSNRLNMTTGPAPAKINSYDAAGNLQTDGTISYTYDANGRMASSSTGKVTTSYLYNGLGQRVAKSTPTGVNYYVYDEDGRLVGEYDNFGRIIQETVYMGGLPVVVLTSASTGEAAGLHYVYADQLGAPRVITRASDNKMVWRWDQADPFGLAQPIENPSGAGNFTYNLRFPGQFFDQETNNHYNYFRDYDPQTGRYIESDPLGLFGGLNTYAYVGSAPTLHADPMGLADLNLFRTIGHDGVLHSWANQWHSDGVYTIAAHGNRYQVLNDFELLDPQDLAKLVRQDPNWRRQPVLLGACNTGVKVPNGLPFGQRLADLLGVPVTAPEAFVWYGPKGLLGAGGPDKPPVDDTGPWRTFFPARKK